MKIQGVATCQYLCMDSCGLLYGSREFGDECVFNETIEQTNYNTYSSSKYSNEKRTFYLALNRRGQPRKVVIRARNQLGRLSSYTRVLTRSVPPDQLHPMRHHGHTCPSPVSHQTQKPHPNSPRCRKKRKRKKKKRKCTDDEYDPDLCQKRQGVSNKHKAQTRNTHKCDDDKDSDVCQRNVTNKNKHIINHSEKPLVSVSKKKKKKKGVRKRLDQHEPGVSQEVTTTTLAPTSTSPPDDVTPDEDYGVDSSTHSDWEDSTAIPDISMAVSDAKINAHPHIDSD